MAKSKTVDVKKGGFSLGDAVMLDDNRCKIIAFGSRTESAIVRVTVPGNKTGRRLAVAVVSLDALKKVKS